MNSLTNVLDGIVMDGDTMNFLINYEKHYDLAKKVLPVALNYIPKTEIIFDFGCGIGTWTKVMIELGYENTLALDLPNFDKNGLVIPSENFLPLNKDLVKKGRGDFSIATRIDTIPEGEQYVYVKSVTSLSPIILFVAKKNENYKAWFKTCGFIEVDCLKEQVSIPEGHQISFFVSESTIGDYEKLNYWYQRKLKKVKRDFKKGFGIRR